jgi:hypothetical protein
LNSKNSMNVTFVGKSFYQLSIWTQKKKIDGFNVKNRTKKSCATVLLNFARALKSRLKLALYHIKN